MQLGKGTCALDPDFTILLTEDDAPDTSVDPEFPLTPSQQKIADKLLDGLSVGEVCLLQGATGTGKTVLLRYIARHLGGVLIPIGRFVALLRDRSPAAIEETFLELVEHHFRVGTILIIDDLHLILRVVEDYDYPRLHLFECALSALLEQSEKQGKKLVFATDLEHSPLLIRQRGYHWRLPSPEAHDYKAICQFYLGITVSRVDYDKLHDFAPALNYHQLKHACIWLRREAEVTHDIFSDYLATHNMVSNVDMDEVPPVDWKQLKGVDDLILELEAKIALPFENQALARQLQLKPKRGVLLAGPPGTGKTTIGRALAHRLKSKFFLIDGTVVAGSGEFYSRVERIFDDAKRNAPSIIFIDDADVIFEEGNHGFYRYLLTMMDGLESASAERVCVMLTAMDPSSLPPAMLRSGRIELWLHIRLPGEEARKEILSDRLRSLPFPLSDANLLQLARATHGLTGADLKAVVEDAKLFFAYDQVAEAEGAPVEHYFLRAIATVRSNRSNYKCKRGSSLMSNPIGFPIEAHL